MTDQREAENRIAELRRLLDEAQMECARLREENALLRRMLGEVGPHDLPVVRESSPTLFPIPQELPVVHTGSPIEQKITLFRTLFRGREDVYPIFWVNERTGKKGYSPARRPAVSRVKRQFRPGLAVRGSEKAKEYLPLTDEVVAAHLSGQTTIGVYPLLRDDTCWFLACDFDGEAWALDAQGFLSICERQGVPAYLERSRSGNGGHVWIFFAAPVPAVSARRLGTWLLRETMVFRSEMDLASYDRFFPNQDFLPKGGLGNLIALPLQKKCRAVGNTEFLDPNLRPWQDQWAYLSKVKRVTPHQLEALLESASGAHVAVGPGSAGFRPRQYPEERRPPSRISCTLAAEISLERVGLPPSLLSQIKHLASLHNPVFYERQRLRLSTFRTPRFIKCYREDASHICLPRGVLEDLEATVRAAGSRLARTDLRSVPVRLPLTFHGTLSPVQEEAAKSLRPHDQGVLVAPPGTGKTVMACFIMASQSVPTLILVHRKPLLDQWRVHLINLLGISPKEIGQIGAGRHRRTGQIDLAMIQSLRDLEDAENFFRDYGLIVIDECHHIPAFSFEACVKQAPVRYVLGLTATPYRRDGLQDIITMQCGPIRHTISRRRAGTENELRLELVIRETDFAFQGTEETPIQEIFRALTLDQTRTDAICKDVLEALARGRRCLVLSERKEHCRSLANRLATRGRTAFVLEGGLRRQARASLLEAIRSGAWKGPPAPGPEGALQSELLIIATGQYLGEGFDCPEIDTLFLTFPVSFKGKLIQYVGRTLRTYEGKCRVIVYDYADVQVPVLNRMLAKRLGTYQALGFVQQSEPGPTQAGLWAPRGTP